MRGRRKGKGRKSNSYFDQKVAGTEHSRGERKDGQNEEKKERERESDLVPSASSQKLQMQLQVRERE